MERIVVGIDGSENSRRALDWALDEARRRQAELDVVHVWFRYPPTMPYVPPSVDDSQTLEAAAVALLDRVVDEADQHDLPTPIVPILVDGSAAHMLVETAKGADLLVVGSRGRGGFAGLLLGSVSQQVVQHAPCPVVVVPEEH